MDDGEVCDNWEQIEENSDVFDKQLEKLNLKAKVGAGVPGDEKPSASGSGRDSQGAHSRVELDSTTPDSLRTQYTSPEPKPLSILSRPKRSDLKSSQHNGIIKTTAKTPPLKSLQQREQEYAEARLRILGDVRFVEEEREAELEAAMSPAEILRMKINEAMQKETSTEESPSKSPRGSHNKSKDKSTEMPDETGPKRITVSKLESGHIVRQPLGPDGSTGFNQQR